MAIEVFIKFCLWDCIERYLEFAGGFCLLHIGFLYGYWLDLGQIWFFLFLLVGIIMNFNVLIHLLFLGGRLLLFFI